MKTYNLKIAMPLEIIDSHEMTGCQYYAWHLIQALAAYRDLKITAIVSDRTPRDFVPANLETQRHYQVRAHGAALLNPLLFFPKKLNRFDLIHCPTVSTPFFFKPKAPVILTVHDLAPRRHPRFSTFKHRLYYRLLVGRQISAADHLIAVSETTKKDIIRIYNQPSEKITVIPEGVDAAFRPAPEPKQDYVLSVATLEPRKNLRRLIESFVEMKQKTRAATRLLLAGKSGWKQAELARFANQWKPDVFFLGYVTRRRLIELYQKASVFIYPSHYEGFGLPVLEAMACGCPVIASNRASLPEVGGGSCLYINPKRGQEIAEAMIRILTDKALARELAQSGLKRAKRFTWDACARRTVKLYHKVA